MSQQFSASQLRAARALLDWSRADLAEQSGVSEPTIHRFENNMGEPEIRTQEKLQRVFEAKGIEFLDNAGVRFRPEGIHIRQGREGLIELMEDIYNSCRMEIAGDVVLSGLSEDDFQKHLGEYDEIYLAKMKALPKFRMRHLIAEGDYNLISSAYSQYRWVPRDQFKAVPFYVYSDKLAIILFSANPAPKIFVVQSSQVADAYRHQFESMWRNAKDIPKKR